MNLLCQSEWKLRMQEILKPHKKRCLWPETGRTDHSIQ